MSIMTAKVGLLPTTPRSSAPCFLRSTTHANGTFGASAERLENFCCEDLAGYKKPRQIVFVDTLPRNALGKVQKHGVREQIIGPEE
jgi:acyl-CoA synthetase (AMP-forming)/AMP-acid ligase II